MQLWVETRSQHVDFDKLVAKPLRGCGPTPSARKRATSPYRRRHGDTEEDIAGSDFVKIITFLFCTL